MLNSIETISLTKDFGKARAVDDISFSVKEGEAAYVSVGHDYLDAPKQLNREKVLEKKMKKPNLIWL